MAILTESKIKRLLRTTNLKETKFLVLEPGTVITPSAKEYLKDITIEYMKTPEASETKTLEAAFPMTQLNVNEPQNVKNIQDVLIYTNGNGQVMWKSHLTYQFGIKINITISRIVALQKKSHCIGNTELAEALNTILMAVKTITMETLASYRLDLVQEIEKLLEDKKQYIDSIYPEGSFIPTYKDEECVIALFELHAYLQELEHFIAKEMKEGLRFEDYIKCISIATTLKDYCWFLMVQMIENSVKQG
jgi:ethanolamine utilization cobalamin adenosyltransferase